MPPLATAFTALTVSSHSGCGRWPFEVKLNGLIWLRTSRKQFHIMGMKDLSVRNEGIRDTREELIEDAVIKRMGLVVGPSGSGKATARAISLR